MKRTIIPLNIDKDILTFDEAAQYLGIGRTTIYKILKQPDPPLFVRFGTKRVISRQSLLEWVTRHEGDIVY